MGSPPPAISFIHLSDIHFSAMSGATSFDLDGDIRHELIRDAQRQVANVSPIRALLVTGDIAYSGTTTEYAKAAAWLDELCVAIGLPSEDVCVVPGNHDVNRVVARASKPTRLIHDSLRNVQTNLINSELRDLLSDHGACQLLLEPLAAYNTFAARYQCAIASNRPFWQRAFHLECGTTILLRGLCSVFVSNEGDQRPNMILGEAQAMVARDENTCHVILCHHPPDWMRDQDAIEAQLEAKVHLQLFGHKHAQRIVIRGLGVRLAAGAMHPEREEPDWTPRYNLIELSRLDAATLNLKIHLRRWDRNSHRFTTENDPQTDRPFYSHDWKVSAPPKTFKAAGCHSQAAPPVLPDNPNPHTPEPILNPKRRLTYRFLSLPFRTQIAIAHAVDVLTDQDRALGDEELFVVLFARAAEQAKLALLWSETEKHHADGASENPFTVAPEENRLA